MIVPSRSMNRTTVLVVEDDTAIRRGLVDALTYAGYGVLDCDNGRKALEVALESTIDLVLLDVMMPHMDGFGVLQELRRTMPTLPVIMVTARGAEEDRIRGLGDGADDYVVKPFSAKELIARVDAVLRRSPQRSGPTSRRAARPTAARCTWSDASCDLVRRHEPAVSSPSARPEILEIPGREPRSCRGPQRAAAARVGPQPTRAAHPHRRHAHRAAA